MSDPRIAIVAHELDVPLGPQAENDGNLEYILDVIAAVDHANEQCGKDLASALRTLERVYLKPTPQGGVLVPLEQERCSCEYPKCPTKAADGRCRCYPTLDGDICVSCGYCIDEA